LTIGKNDWDGLHYQSIVNALSFFGSEPILVTADKRFGNKVESKGYRVIIPLKNTINQIESILT